MNYTQIKNGKVCILIWMNMPSHHQSAFFDAIRSIDIDLVVHYYGRVSEKRKLLGWTEISILPIGESLVTPELASLEKCPDWRNRIHIVPGYGTPFLRSLVKTLSRNGVPWLHWSEPASNGLRWWFSYLTKRWYAKMVNTYSCGALAIGDLARRDFIRWGIFPNKIWLLPYSVAGFSDCFQIDNEIENFTKESSISFLYIGALYQLKGIDIMLSAFQKVVSSYPTAKLVIVGSDLSGGKYRALVHKLRIENSVFFRGKMPANMVGEAIAGCQVLVLPSRRSDGWGMVINEAASAGKAIIASTLCGAAHHLISDGNNGFIIQPNNIKELANRMAYYASSPTMAMLHGELSRKIYSGYTPLQNAQRLWQIILPMR